ncbi:hypothetical protein PHLH6_09080 [Pseudomonas sp. Seg1]|nr:hypothetical protein PHLH6_09080 [Pseudomonas sp. Seg1]
MCDIPVIQVRRIVEDMSTIFKSRRENQRHTRMFVVASNREGKLDLFSYNSQPFR